MGEEDGAEGLGEDFQIEPEGPRLGIAEIEADHVVK